MAQNCIDCFEMFRRRAADRTFRIELCARRPIRADQRAPHLVPAREWAHPRPGGPRNPWLRRPGDLRASAGIGFHHDESSVAPSFELVAKKKIGRPFFLGPPAFRFLAALCLRCFPRTARAPCPPRCDPNKNSSTRNALAPHCKNRSPGGCRGNFFSCQDITIAGREMVSALGWLSPSPPCSSASSSRPFFDSRPPRSALRPRVGVVGANKEQLTRRAGLIACKREIRAPLRRRNPTIACSRCF